MLLGLKICDYICPNVSHIAFSGVSLSLENQVFNIKTSNING